MVFPLKSAVGHRASFRQTAGRPRALSAAQLPVLMMPLGSGEPAPDRGGFGPSRTVSTTPGVLSFVRGGFMGINIWE